MKLILVYVGMTITCKMVYIEEVILVGKITSNNRLLRKVAVLLAAFNGMKWINEQINSIVHQENIELILFVSVDLSDDGTYEFIQKLALVHQNIQILPYGERFGGAAPNFFHLIKDVEFSGFDYVAFADQDDIWMENKLSHAIAKIESKNLDALSSDVIAFWPDGRERLVKKSYSQKQFDYYFEAAGPGCTYVFKQSALSKFKVFLQQNWQQINEVDLHDWMIYSYFRAQSMKWLIDEEPLMRYRQHEENQVGFNSGFSAYSKRIGMVNGGWYRGQVLKIVRLLQLRNESEFNLSRWFLIKNFLELRRRPRDAYALVIMLLLGVF